MTWLRVDLRGYLLGDILAVSLTDLLGLWWGMLVLVLWFCSGVRFLPFP
ncbi:MAG: hypothetical protein Ct9H90mP9_3160 [Pseudomonadota bacterium]|nr:MAG: hypothetical protein Ct9H90mP9_3160 [Pseudomonadota bacterium]